MAQFRPRQAPEPLPETPNPPTLTSLSQQLIREHQFLAHQAQSTNILRTATAARNHLEVMRSSNQLLAAQDPPAQLAPATVAAMEAMFARSERQQEERFARFERQQEERFARFKRQLQGQLDLITNQLGLLNHDLESLRQGLARAAAPQDQLP
ncbi:hypothetical protein PGT21_010961 [Puccinia graminis f. sp. tritici]|uniref:Uncharacterized protein n=1 Tax=Puccinia graminis f. sp. tritici TaxID=56615 RepID=A0A5B0PHV7_PUCGR|nr:hypothetical protein PGT21_010961 [Puccinia graminis f. sp. tritici]